MLLGLRDFFSSDAFSDLSCTKKEPERKRKIVPENLHVFRGLFIVFFRVAKFLCLFIYEILQFMLECLDFEI